MTEHLWVGLSLLALCLAGLIGGWKARRMGKQIKEARQKLEKQEKELPDLVRAIARSEQKQQNPGESG